jgi:hypothetical protein
MPDIFDTIEIPKANTFSGKAKRDIFDEVELPTKPQESVGQMLMRNLGKAGQETYREGIAPILEGASTFAGGIPRLVAKVLGPEAEKAVFPEQQTLPGKVLRGASEIAGFTAGLPGQAAKFVGRGIAKGAEKVIPRFAGKALLSKIAQGVGTGAVGMAVAGDTIENRIKGAKTGALIGGALPGVDVGIKKIAASIPQSLKNSSARIINSLVKPLLKDFSYGKNPGLAVAQEGIVANNLDELSQKISQRRQEVGQKIDVMLSNPRNASKVIDLSNLTDPVDSAIKQAQKNPRTNAALIKRLTDMKMDILGITEDAQGNIISQRDFTKLSPVEARQIKTDIGDITKWTGNLSDDKLANMPLKKVYGLIKDKINKVVPEVAPLNERYADLTSAEVATKYRDKINQRQNLISLTDLETGLGGAVLTAIASGGQTIPALLVGASSIAIKKAISSPTFKTRVATGLAKMSQGELSQLLSKYPQLRQAIFDSIKKAQKF